MRCLVLLQPAVLRVVVDVENFDDAMDAAEALHPGWEAVSAATPVKDET